MMRRSFLGRIVALLAAPFVAVRSATLYGIPYWIVPNRGKRSSWTNYTTTYTDVKKEDFVRAMRRAIDNPPDLAPPLREDVVYLERPEWVDYPKWDDYTAALTNVNADVLREIRRLAAESMDFEPPLGADYVELKGNLDATGGLDGQH